MPQSIYTVSELTLQIRALLEQNFPSVWVSGEISNFKAHTSGHFYFSLKDAKGQIQGVMFRGSNRFLKFKPEDGLEVIANGRVTVYEARGQYQLVVEYLEPKGLGALQLAFEQLKKKLEAEGLFDASRKRALPLLPKKIGVVTSPTGAVIHDLIHVLKRRYPNIEILLNPVRVQGEGAAEEIAAAILEMNTFEEIDVLIVGRGGGSLEDLWAFNTEVVARAIATSRIPIISAVGHEVDFTIADFVADLRAPTPSAAAEMAVHEKSELELYVRGFKERLSEKIYLKLKDLRDQLDFFKSHLKHPKQRLEELSQRVDDLSERLQMALKNHLRLLKQKVESDKTTLQALSPLAVLNRGYSITYQREKIAVKDAGQVSLNSEIEIWLAQGKLKATVTKKIDPFQKR